MPHVEKAVPPKRVGFASTHTLYLSGLAGRDPHTSATRAFPDEFCRVCLVRVWWYWLYSSWDFGDFCTHTHYTKAGPISRSLHKITLTCPQTNLVKATQDESASSMYLGCSMGFLLVVTLVSCSGSRAGKQLHETSATARGARRLSAQTSSSR